MGKKKEIHLYLDRNKLPEDIDMTIMDTMESIYNEEKEVVNTTQVEFLSFKYSERLFVHVYCKVHEITLGDCKGTTREIRPAHNLAKMLISGAFSFFDGI